MKARLLYAIIAVMILCVLFVGCATEDTTAKEVTTTERPVSMVEALNEIGFGADFSQSDLAALLKEATYQGKTLLDQGMWLNADDAFGGGAYFSFDGVASAENWYQRRENEPYADYTNSLTLLTEVEGITIPCGIRFGDRIAEVLSKLGIRFDLDGLSSEEETAGVITLKEEDSEAVKQRLTLTKVSLLPEGASKPDDMLYVLTFSEVYDAPYGPSTQKITRSVILYFGLGEAKLKKIVFRSDAVLPTASQTQPSKGEDADGGATVSKTLSAFLDREGFVPPVTQSLFVDSMKKYTYEGKTMLDVNGGWFVDGEYGGGLICNGDLFGFTNMAKYETLTNDMYTSVALDGLLLPFDIEFSDTLTDILHKMGLVEDGSFADRELTTFLSDSDFDLILYQNTAENEEKTYKLVYHDRYQAYLNDGRQVDINRQIEFRFDAADMLCHIAMQIEQKNSVLS